MINMHSSRLTKTLLVLGTGLVASSAHSTILFDQMTNPTQSIITSSWVSPDGTDADTYAYDNFLLANTSTINEVWWIGGGGSPTSLTVRFYEGLPSSPDYQPKITNLPTDETPADYLKGYSFTGNGNETAIQGSSLKQYHVVLPTALTLQGNTVYWLKIEADVVGYPGWGLATASHGRDARHITYYTGGPYFLPGGGSEAFQLIGSTVPEPATMAVLGFGALALIRRRR